MGDVTPTKSPGGAKSAPSSLPKPIFIAEPLNFSTKKERGTPPMRPPPRPQAKTCPPISRVFKRRQELFAAQAVTFLDSGESSSLTGTPFPTSAHYEPSNKASYFEQAFTIEEKIGAGCFGTVYKVRSKEDGKLYAVKIAQEKYKGRSDRKEKLEEVRKHQFLLPHSNCVHFYQSWEDNGRLYQKFELCEKSLMDLSEEKHDLPESLIWAYLVDLLLAVQHLHDHDLIHMDIKPENIFIGMDGICKLGDFGLVIDLAKMDTSKAVEGDPRYLANEVLQDRKFTKAADIFALGVTILELATDLDLPKHGALWHQLRQTGPDPKLTKHLSQDLRLVIQLMMGNNHERRPTVKQLLDLPAVRKARAKRVRDLAIQHFLLSLQSTLGAMFWPIVAFFLTCWSFFLVPFKMARNKINRMYHDSRMTTPVAQNYVASWPNFKQHRNGISFSSDEDDFSTSSAQTSALASPLTINFSDEEEEELQQSKKKRTTKKKTHKLKFEEPLQPTSRLRRHLVEPMSAPQVMGPPATQSTPKTTAAQRFRARYQANATPFFSPKKKLDFDAYDTSLDGSPRLRKQFDFSTSDTPPSGSSRGANSSFSTNQDEGSSASTIKPVSLASKFDCFSDSD